MRGRDAESTDSTTPKPVISVPQSMPNTRIYCKSKPKAVAERAPEELRAGEKWIRKVIVGDVLHLRHRICRSGSPDVMLEV